MQEAAIAMKILYWFVSACVCLAWCFYLVFEVANEMENEETEKKAILVVFVVLKEFAVLSLFVMIGYAIGKALKIF
ncbi:MAG: hypothetical protein AB9915_03270 [Candidatus Dojkabacteria bacterium]